MRFGEPKPVEGKCNARLYIGDNYGDNHTTMMCQLEPLHDGDHQESYQSSGSGRVTTTWELEDPQIAIDDLQREIERAIEGAYPTTYVDYEWLEESQTDLSKYALEGKTVFFRLENSRQVWVAIGDPMQQREMSKDLAIQALIEGLKP